MYFKARRLAINFRVVSISLQDNTSIKTNLVPCRQGIRSFLCIFQPVLFQFGLEFRNLRFNFRDPFG
jgi:hypothetical protein